MNADDALALARRMLQQLARRPGLTRTTTFRSGASYRERAAVLVDVLSYAGWEMAAEDLALAVAGRYPSDQAYHPGVTGTSLARPGRMPGDPIRPGDELEVLTLEVEAIHRRLRSRRPPCALGPKAVREWLVSLTGDAPPDVVRAIVNDIRNACGAKLDRRMQLTDALYGVIDELRLSELGLEDLPLTPYRDNGFDYVNLRNATVPTIAVLYPRHHSWGRFTIASLDDLVRWSAQQ